MRSNKQKTQQTSKAYEIVLRLEQKARYILGLGMNGRQWLACIMICTLLLSTVSFPAAVYANTPASSSGEFEPVNEELSFWTENWRNLNAKIESWTTPYRSGNELVFENEDEKKKKKKQTTPEVKTDKKAVEEKKGDHTEKDSNKTEKPDAETPDNEKATPKSDAETGNQTKPANKKPVIRSQLLLNQLPDDERGSVYNYENNLGAPRGQTESDSSNEAAALRIRHRAGIANFNFGISLASLSGRGMDAGVGLNYNSRIWNKSVNANAEDHFTYDVEQSWIAPGFSSGLGYLETSAMVRYIHPHQSSNFTYHTEITPVGSTDADGTRRQFACVSSYQIAGTYTYKCTKYRSSDGSFINIPAQSWNGNPNNSQTPNTTYYPSKTFTATYSNGTKVYYSGGFGTGTTRKHYPYIIEDSNGNRIRIFYKSDQSGRIDFIADTLNRQIKFYYENDSNGNPDKLVAVTIPGMGTNDEIQTVRFYYENLTLQSGGFVSTAQVTAPSTIRVLKYVLMPATKTGYKYEYHPKYGMIKKITRQVGMTGSTTATNSTGTLTEGIFAASTEYDYPDGSTPLDDVPKYTKRTDDWQGRTSTNAQETLYDQPTGTADIISRITVKDNGFDVMTESVSAADTGLLKETSVTKIFGPSGQYTQLMSKSQYTWTGRNLTKLEVTNEAGLVKKTEYEYDQYNNQTRVKEYDFGTSNPTLLRTTEIAYETGTGWINANLLNLPKSVKTIVGGVTVSKTLYEYDHGGNDSTLVLRGQMDTAYTIGTHNPSHNPEIPETCMIVCADNPEATCENPGQDCNLPTFTSGYDPASAYRGNVTKVAGMLDVNATTIDDERDDVTEVNYDILGNLVSSTLSCCQLRTFSYDSNYFTFITSQTSGTSPTQLTTSSTYNGNTGLVLTSTNENNQVTTYEYETDTLRPKKITFPNGGYIQTEYSDKLITNANDLLPSFVRTTTTLETNKTVQSYSYTNGGGLGIRNATQTPDGWSVSATEFDKLRRPFKSYNPFFVSTPTGAIPGGAKFTEVLSLDALGRTTSVQLQDNTTLSIEFGNASTTPSGFNLTFVTFTDQAGKKRRQLSDALNRLMRVDEPDANGNLGAVNSPNQPTFYEYDGNDNLSKVTQSDGTITQERLFKYDALSRLTHEKQVEASSTLNDSGAKVSSGGLWTKVQKYDPHGLLTDTYDANGVNKHFTYDGLNRVTSIQFSGESGYETPDVNYTYDAENTGFYNKGQLTKVTTAAVTGTQATPATEQIYDYDNMGRIAKHQQKIDSQSYLLEYGYNLAGHLTSKKYPSGRIVNLGYDAYGRLSTVADAQRTYLTGFSFGSRTLPSQMNLGNGTNQTFTYNDRLQMTNHTLSRGSNVVQQYDYGFGQIDTNGNLDTTKNNGQLARVESYIGTAKQWTQKFKYDSTGRLHETEEKRGDTGALSYKQIFEFDRFSNLYRKNASNPTTGQENPLPYNTIEDSDIDKNKNRFTSGTGTTYNDAGQVVTDNKFRSMGFSYDANGRMVKATKANTPDATSVYDALGNRIAVKVNDIWQFLIYDAFGQLIAEYGGVADTDEGGVSYFLSDYQGSIRTVLNNSGFVQSRTDYQAFGEEIQSGVGLRTAAQGFTGNAQARQGYASTERDEATGMNHAWFRKNENRAGRWTSPDPYNGSMDVGNPQSFNRYTYTDNEPVNNVDPTGLLIAKPYNCSLGCVLKIDSGGGYYWDCVMTCFWEFINIGNGVTSDTTLPYDPNDTGGGLIDGLPNPPTKPSPTPKNDKSPADQQKEFNDCATRAYRAFRTTYLKDGGKTLLGGVLIGIGLYALFRGAKAGKEAAAHAGPNPVQIVDHALAAPKAAGMASLSPLTLGGMLIGGAIDSTAAAQQKLERDLDNCKKNSPNANHSLSWVTL